MSTATRRKAGVAEKEREGRAATDEKKKTEEGGGTAVLSYWGISRPKITKEDGTVWPWNCFLVIYLLV